MILRKEDKDRLVGKGLYGLSSREGELMSLLLKGPRPIGSEGSRARAREALGISDAAFRAMLSRLVKKKALEATGHGEYEEAEGFRGDCLEICGVGS